MSFGTVSAVPTYLVQDNYLLRIVNIKTYFFIIYTVPHALYIIINLNVKQAFCQKIQYSYFNYSVACK